MSTPFSKEGFRWRIRKRGKQIYNICATVLFFSFVTFPAFANPVGGTVTAGDAAITSSANEVQITQHSDRAIINWQSFDIAAGETTRFIQPNSSSIALNRVVNSTQLSTINGNLTANGRVIVMNPNGVVIGAQGHIDTAGFIATTADIADDKFMNATTKMSFDKPGRADAAVDNHGQISIRDAGLAALVAPTVRNDGLIEGNLSKVHLAAGDTFAVDLYGDRLVNLAVQTPADGSRRQLLAENTGTIMADAGRVVMNTAAVSQMVEATINTSGHIQARGIEQKNGEIILTGAGATVNVSGTVDASGANGGGDVRIGGGSMGHRTLAKAAVVNVTTAATIKADAEVNGNGGSITVWSDKTTATHGSFSARGGSEGGNGGLVETSSKDDLDVGGTLVNTSAPHGKFGNWLLDPTTLTVDSTLASTISASSTNYTLSATGSISFSANVDISTYGVGLTATAGSGGISMSNSYIRTNHGDVAFNTTGAITLNGAGGVKFLYTRGGAINLTGDTISTNNALIGSSGGTVSLTATAQPGGNTKTISINSTYIDTTGGNGSGGVSLYTGSPSTLYSGTLSQDATFFGNSNTFENTRNGAALTITGKNIGGNSNCFSAGGTLCTVSDPVAPTAITVFANALSKTYGTSDPLFTYTYTGALNSGDSFTGNLSRVSGENVGAYAINEGSLAITGSGNYSITYNSNNFSITPYTLAITALAKSKVYGAVDPGLTYSHGALQNGDTSSVFSGNLGRTAGENVGTYAINRGTLSAGGNYTLSYTGNNLSITPYTLAVTAAAKNKVYGATDPSLTYTFGSLQNGDSSSVFTGGLSRASGENVGTYAINQGSLSAGGNYTLSYTGNNLSITPYTLAVTAASKSKVYGSSDPSLTYSYGSLQNGDTSSVFSGNLSRAAGENVGSYAINQNTLSAGGNYTLSYTGSNLAITPYTLAVTAASKSKVYGDSDPALTYNYGALKNGDTASIFTGNLNRASGENVGAYAINQGTLSAGNNYTLSYTSNNLSITPYTLAVTAASKSKIYGDSDPALTYSYASLKNGDPASVFNGGLGRTAGENVGTYAINQSSLSAGSNYTIAYTGNNLSVTPYNLTVTAIAKSKVYGDSDPALTYSYASLKNGDTSSVFSGGLNRTAGENVGNYAINQGTLSAGSNYTLSYTGNSLSITPYALAVTAASKNKVYGDADPALVYTYGSLKNGDTSSVFSGDLNRTSGENVGSYAINQGTLSAGNNYTLSYTGNNLSITPATLSVAASHETKTYGDADPALAYTYGALKNGDTSSVFSDNLNRSAGENVGSYAINQGTLSAGGNYSIAYTGNTLTITPYTLAVSANNLNKVYGSVDPALTYSYASLKNGDTSSVFSGNLNRTSGENAGTYAINQGTLSAGSNYNLDFTGNNFSITPYSLVVTAAAKSKAYGSSDPALTYTYGTLQNGDTSSVFSGGLSRTAGENAGTYAVNQGTLLAGGNYIISFVGHDFSITAAAPVPAPAIVQQQPQWTPPPLPNPVAKNETRAPFTLGEWKNVIDTPKNNVFEVAAMAPAVSAPVQINVPVQIIPQAISVQPQPVIVQQPAVSNTSNNVAAVPGTNTSSGVDASVKSPSNGSNAVPTETSAKNSSGSSNAEPDANSSGETTDDLNKKKN